VQALTLHRPWPAAILYLGKRVENRTWRPPAVLVGQAIAIHAGNKVMGPVAIPPDTPEDQVELYLQHRIDRGLVATARIVDVTRYSCPPGQEWWWGGPYGWVLDDVRPLHRPLTSRGAQGLWPVADHLRGILERHAA